MAEDRVRPAGEHCSELPCERWGDGMSDQEHAEVDPVEPAAGQATGDCSPAEPDGKELPARDEPALGGGDPRDHVIDPTGRVQDVARVGPGAAWGRFAVCRMHDVARVGLAGTRGREVAWPVQYVAHRLQPVARATSCRSRAGHHRSSVGAEETHDHHHGHQVRGQVPSRYEASAARDLRGLDV